MSKKIVISLLALVMALAVIIGCVGCAVGGNEGTNPSETTSATNPSEEGTKATEGTSEPTEVTKPKDSETTDPTEGATTAPTETQPKETEPEETQPKETEPKETQPKETEPKPTEHSHSYSSVVTAPTCTKDGYTTYTCACGSSYTADKVSKTGHKFGDWYTTKEPTETATGTAERKCSACGTTETKTLDKLPESHKHSYTGKVTTKATCTKDGEKTFTCSCGDSYIEKIPATGHSYSVTSEKAGTCCEAGSKTYTCSDCSDSYTESTGKADHSWVHHHTPEVGHYQQVIVCHCGWSCSKSQAEAAGYSIDKYMYLFHVKQFEGTDEEFDHTYYNSSEWVIDTPAVDYYECSVCGARK